MGRKLQRTLLIGGIFAVAIVGYVALVSMKPEPPTRERTARAMLVEAIELSPSEADIVIRSQGTVMPRTETVLSAEVSGAIVDISSKFIAGGVFAKNEVLMRIDPAPYKVAVDQAKALLRQRQIEHDGAEKLRSQGYRAEAEFAAAQAALASAKAELVRAERDLDRTYIRLPYAGMVRSKDADLGQFVIPGTRLGVTFATDFAEVRLPLTDQDLAFVELPQARDITETGSAEGQPVTLTAVQRGELVNWTGRIVRSEGIVDESSRVTHAVARIDDPYGFDTDHAALPIGTFVAASIAGVLPGEMIRVPRSAIRGSNQLVFLDAENRIAIRDVDVFRFDAEYAYLRGDDLAGQRVVTTTLESPINGTVVRTTSDPEEQGGSDTSQLASTDEDL